MIIIFDTQMINTLGVSFIAIFSKLDLILILAFSANRDKIHNFNHFFSSV